MGRQRDSEGRGSKAASLLAGALVLAAVPSAGLALDGAFGLIAGKGLTAFTPASVDPDVARLVAERSIASNREMRFTPAGFGNRASRSVTVAVRIDEDAAQAISVRSALAAMRDQAAGKAPVVIAPTRYNLGLSRGYQSFAQKSALSEKLSGAAIPDLASYRPAPGAPDKPSRLVARIALEEQAKAGNAPRTMNSIPDQSLDVGGSYRLTSNLDVTAGVRYSQERDRLAPLADPARQDSQAVYVGTQFRF